MGIQVSLFRCHRVSPRMITFVGVVLLFCGGGVEGWLNQRATSNALIFHRYSTSLQSPRNNDNRNARTKIDKQLATLGRDEFSCDGPFNSAKMFQPIRSAGKKWTTATLMARMMKTVGHPDTTATAGKNYYSMKKEGRGPRKKLMFLCLATALAVAFLPTRSASATTEALVSAVAESTVATAATAATAAGTTAGTAAAGTAAVGSVAGTVSGMNILRAPVPWKVELGLTLRLFLAALMGGAVGKERSATHKHSAGVRTMALVALGAASFTISSMFGFALLGNKYDPSRMASNVASGVGFVGAGVITTTSACPDSRQSVVHGLTTATAIWISAAIGVACGVGMFYIAASAAATTIAILRCGRAKKKFRKLSEAELAARRYAAELQQRQASTVQPKPNNHGGEAAVVAVAQQEENIATPSLSIQSQTTSGAPPSMASARTEPPPLEPDDRWDTHFEPLDDGDELVHFHVDNWENWEYNSSSPTSKVGWWKNISRKQQPDFSLSKRKEDQERWERIDQERLADMDQFLDQQVSSSSTQPLFHRNGVFYQPYGFSTGNNETNHIAP